MLHSYRSQARAVTFVLAALFLPLLPGRAAAELCDLCQPLELAEGQAEPASLIPNWSDAFHRDAEFVLAALPEVPDAPGIFEPSGMSAPAPVMASSPTDSLPENMPLVTKIFWGRHGLLREIGLSPSTRRTELRTRHRMLSWHPRLGLLTWGAMTAQVITGTLIYTNREAHYASLEPIHKVMGYTTFGLYSLTASLSLLAPPARRYGEGISSIKIHRYLAIIHFAGMMAQPWLGRWAAHANSPEAYDSRIRTHRIVGWVTYGALTAAMISIVLPIY
ncbi:MAG TPA: hypothetical protein VFG50_06640 [Rhodothermales bacterium]|nr:hypothetical protein [Rhodothermales bacterium]